MASLQFLLKILVSALVIAAVSEIAKRSSAAAAILASLPLTSLLAFVFLYYETGDSRKVIDLSNGIFWMILPSLALFVSLPILLKKGMSFPWALSVSAGLTSLTYFAFAILLGKFGIKI